QEYLLEFSSEYDIPESLHPELPGPEEMTVEFPEGKVDLFNLISAPNPTNVKTRTCPRAAHEVPILTVTVSRVIEMEDVAVASECSGTEDRVQDEVAYEIPPTGNASTTGVALETGLEKEVAVMGPLMNKRHCKRGSNEAEANAPPKVLRRDHDAFCPAQITHKGKSIASMGLDAGSILPTPAAQGPSTTMKSASDAEPLSSKEAATEIPTEKVATIEVNIQFFVGSPESKRSTSVPFVVGSSGSIYQPGWGVTNDYLDMADHIVLPGYFSELRHLPNADFLSQYNINLARQVAMGSQLRLRFEQEVRLLKKSRSKIAKRDQRIQVREEEIKKLDQEIQSLRAVESEVHDL
ncbi:hypothetical protein Tco_1390625, partial [Tanacetum coccineum]